MFRVFFRLLVMQIRALVMLSCVVGINQHTVNLGWEWAEVCIAEKLRYYIFMSVLTVPAENVTDLQSRLYDLCHYPAQPALEPF